MWPFQRKVEAPAAEGPRPVPAPVIRRDWAGMPPIQRIVGAHPLTAPSDQFSDDLATHQDPSVTSDTMGHQVSADAPPGLVLALARPTTRSDGPAMIPRPRVQRSVASAVRGRGEGDGEGAARDRVRPPLSPGRAPAAAARELPVVAAEPAMQRLTSLARGADPAPIAPVAHRSRAVPTPTAATAPALANEPFEVAPVPAQRLTLGQSRRMGLGAPIKQVPDHSVQRTASDSMLLPPGPKPALPQRTESTAAVREPMDASIAHHDPMDVSLGQRLPMDLPPAATAPMDMPPVQRAPKDLPVIAEAPADLSSGVRTRASSLGAARTPPVETGDAPRLELPLARRPAAEEAKGGNRSVSAPAPSVQLSAASTPDPVTDSSPAPPPALQRLASTESRQTLMMSSAPMAPSPRVSASSPPPVTESPARASAISAIPARDAATMAPLVGTLPLRPFAMLQRSTSTVAPNQTEDAPHSDAPPQRGRELAFASATDDTPTLTLPQRGSDDDGTILQRGWEDTSSPAPPTRAELPSMRGRDDGARRPLPLAPSRVVAVQRAAQTVDDSETDSTEAPSDSNASVVQGAWYDSISAGVKSLTSGAGSSVASTVGSAVGGVASSLGGHKADETDMDELAGKLYDQIRSRLKTELLVDRERAGFLTDLR